MKIVIGGKKPPMCAFTGWSFGDRLARSISNLKKHSCHLPLQPMKGVYAEPGGKPEVISIASGGEVGMELVIRIGLMFFFLQFLVITTVMSVAMLMARPETPVQAREPGRAVLKRWIAATLHLPARGFGAVRRRVHSMRLRSVH
jgi:hypothetical protein